MTKAFDGGVSCGHLLQQRFQARKENEQGASRGARECTGKGKPSLKNRQAGRKEGGFVTSQAEDEAEILTTGIR